MDLSIVIVSYDAVYDLICCINSIINHVQDTEYEIIIVDNNSTQNNVKIIRERYPQISLIENEQNIGYGAANNLGVKIANGRYITILNPDTELISNIFKPLIQIYNNNHINGIMGVAQTDLNNNIKKSHLNYPNLLRRVIMLSGIKSIIKPVNNFYQNNSIPKQINLVESVSGAFLFMERDLYNKFNGFDEKYFLYHEELDLCYRLTNYGYDVLLNNNERIIHKGSNSEDPTNEFVFLQRNKSLLYFYRKHYSKISYYTLILMNIIFYGIRMIGTIKKQNRKTYHTVIKLNLNEMRRTHRTDK